MNRELAARTFRREDLPEDATIATWSERLGWVVDARQPHALEREVRAYCAFRPDVRFSTFYVPANAPLDWIAPLLFIVWQPEYVPHCFLWENL